MHHRHRTIPRPFRLVALVALAALLFTVIALPVSTVSAAPGGRSGNAPGQGLARGHAKGGPPVFSDVSGDHWAWRHISMMGAKGVLAGYGDGRFGPSNNVTRLELVIMVTRMLGYEDEALALDPAEVTARLAEAFRDYRNLPAWPGARECLAYALEEGYLWPLTQRASEVTFRAGVPAKRVEVVVMLLEGMGLGDEAEEMTDADISFRDARNVPAWAWGYVALAVEMGLLRGDGGNLRPNQPVTRAEMAALLERADIEIDTDLDRDIVRGTVSAVTVTTGTGTQSTITIIPDEAGADADDAETYVVASGAMVILNGVRAALGDIRPGDDAALYLNVDGQVVLLDVDYAITTLNGTLVSLTFHGTTGALTAVTLRPEGQTTSVTYGVTPDLEITIDGEDADPSDLAVGDSIRVKIARDAIFELAVTTSGADDDDEPTVTYSTGLLVGMVLNTQGQLATITVAHTSATTTYAVAADVAITADGAASTVANLNLNTEVRIGVADGYVVSIATGTGVGD